MSACVFCEIVAGRAPATIVKETETVIAIVPLGPVTPGHILFIPRVHVRDASEHPPLTGEVAQAAADWGSLRYEWWNLITSVGRAATQSVFHLHWHYVPRKAGDGLVLPWGDNTRHLDQ